MYTDTSRRVKFCVAHPGCTAQERRPSLLLPGAASPCLPPPLLPAPVQIHVIADPLLTLSLPPTLTVWTGMDAVCPR